VQLRTNVPITLLHLSLGCRRGLGGFGAGMVLQWWEQTQVYLIELNLVAWPST